MRSLLPLSLLLLLLPTPPQQDATTTLRVDTKLTVVNVTVTDKYGNPVHGLKPSDFVIKEDGKAQPIRNFDEFSAAHPLVTPAGPKLPPGIYTNQPGAISTGSINILLFSQLERAEQMIYARSEAENYLKTMPEGTRVTILVLGNGGVRVVQNITADRDILLGAIHSLKYEQIGGTSFATAHSLGMACEVANERSRVTLDALNQIAASVSANKGKKNLIWFTHGIPWLTNYPYFSGYLKVTCLDNDTDKLHQAYSMLAAAQVAIYTVDPIGLDVGSIGNPAGAFVDRQINQESIRDFAEATGGVAYYNRNDLDAATRQAISVGSDYYSIAYTPPLQGYDGKYHSISVKVNQPNLQLSYRKGYTSLDLANLNNAIAESANSGKSDNTRSTSASAQLPPAIAAFRADMGHGTPAGTQFLFATRVAPTVTPAQAAPAPVEGNLSPKVKPNPLIRYDVVYSIPASELTVSGGHAAVEFDIVAYGEDGTRLNYVSQTAQLSIKPEAVARQDGLLMPFQLDLPPGKLFLRIGALDVPSGKYGTLEVPQTIAKPAKFAAKSAK